LFLALFLIIEGDGKPSFITSRTVSPYATRTHRSVQKQQAEYRQRLGRQTPMLVSRGCYWNSSRRRSGLLTLNRHQPRRDAWWCRAWFQLHRAIMGQLFFFFLVLASIIFDIWPATFLALYEDTTVDNNKNTTDKSPL
jgi:hypothetical protein